MHQSQTFDPVEGARETRDRARRMETKITKIAEHLGITSGVERPRYENGRILIGSRKCQLDELMGIVPADMHGEVIDICVGQQVVATFTVER